MNSHFNVGRASGSPPSVGRLVGGMRPWFRTGILESPTDSQSGKKWSFATIQLQNKPEIIQHMRPHFQTEFRHNPKYATSFPNRVPKAQLLGPKQVRNNPKSPKQVRNMFTICDLIFKPSPKSSTVGPKTNPK